MEIRPLKAMLIIKKKFLYLCNNFINVSILFSSQNSKFSTCSKSTSSMLITIFLMNLCRMMRKLQKVIINVNFDLLSTEEKIRGCILILFNTD